MQWLVNKTHSNCVWPEMKRFCVETCGWEQQSRLIGTSWEKEPSAHTYLTLIHLSMLLMTSQPEAWRSSSPVEYRAVSAWKGWVSSSRTQCWNQITALLVREAHQVWCLWHVVGLCVCRKSCMCLCLLSGQKYWVVQELKTKSRAGSIYEYGFPSRVRQVDAAVHVAETGKTIFFTGQFYYRYT